MKKNLELNTRGEGAGKKYMQGSFQKPIKKGAFIRCCSKDNYDSSWSQEQLSQGAEGRVVVKLSS
jgi:hypothetical protein